jgi:tyrosine decarboxylase/aspartate 1-decarboxylase
MHMKDIRREAHNTLFHGFSHLPRFDQEYDWKAIDDVLQDAAKRMQNNYPYHHPLYVGQMLKPPHPVAQMAYGMAMEINPNNHALDGGRESSKMEKEAVKAIAAMFGFDEHLGHLTGGGTMANLEAIWLAGQIKPGKMIAASENAHYTHSRISSVLNIPFVAIKSDEKGQMDLGDLRHQLENHNIGTVVVTLGTTGSGSLDDLASIRQLQGEFHFRIHVDAAYGGYFILADKLSGYSKTQFNHIRHADSVVIDPHKHGLQPYGCGCIILKNPEEGQFYKHDSPYTYFTGDDLHLGEISLECSRPGAAAVALWCTQQLLPYVARGEFAGILDNCLQTARWLYAKITEDDRFKTILEPELDIVLWAPQGESLSAISEKSKVLFKVCASRDLHLALYNIPGSQLPDSWEGILKNQRTVTVLRSCLMKPEHWDWKDRIWEILSDSVDSID